MKIGDWVKTPRFLNVKISEVYDNNDIAYQDGYTEPTHYRDSEYHIRGKHTNINRMEFAAIKRDI